MRGPCLVYADAKGNIYDHPELGMAGSAGGVWSNADPRDLISLPEGSELFLMPGRLPVGIAPGGEPQVLERDPLGKMGVVSAVAAFMAPAYTATLSAAFKTQPQAPNLPLFSYAAVGFHHGEFVAAGLRMDFSPRQDFKHFPPPERIAAAAKRLLRANRNNRLWQQLGTCALTYACPAARNLMLGRWEAPLPVSPVCNAACLGCLNDQPQGAFPLSQHRLSTPPSAEEVAEVALYHFRTGREPMVSFGQGCEGEPLLMGDLLTEATILIRSQVPRAEGTINLNTNGSLPRVVARLMEAGLSSIRVSVNSLVQERHQAYYQPQGWSLDDALESLRVVKRAGGHTAINLLTLPGVTDRTDEVEALYTLVETGDLDMIQWRNLNMDPEYYVQALGLGGPAELKGIGQLIREMRGRFPALRHGYFNPRLPI